MLYEDITRQRWLDCINVDVHTIMEYAPVQLFYIKTNQASYTTLAQRPSQRFTIIWSGNYGFTNVAEITVDTSNLVGGGTIVVETQIEGSATDDEIQTITMSGTITGGSFTISWNPGGGIETTSAIAWDATASNIETGLNTMTSVVDGDFDVLGSEVEGPGSFSDTFPIPGNGERIILSVRRPADVAFNDNGDPVDFNTTTGVTPETKPTRWTHSAIGVNGPLRIEPGSIGRCTWDINPAIVTLSSGGNLEMIFSGTTLLTAFDPQGGSSGRNNIFVGLGSAQFSNGSSRGVVSRYRRDSDATI